MNKQEIFGALGLSEHNSGVFAGEWLEPSGEQIEVVNPTTGEILATVGMASAEDYDRVVAQSVETFDRWRLLPAPQRGQYVRRLGDALRESIEPLGALVTLEMGKIFPEGVGEVQEMVDICDFAVGLSRQLYGSTMASERPNHRMYEHWHPLGPVGVISAFNFPVAVWSWNSALAAVCGDTVVWKPSERTPLTAIAVTRIAQRVMEGSGFEGVFNLVVGDGATIGNRMNQDTRLPLISATGSCNMGRIVGPAVAQRMGRTILELGGNNAVIVMDDANLDLAVRATLFSAVGTAGQRCTSLRRLLVHRAVADKMVSRLAEAYKQVKIGDPLETGTLMGPLVGERAVAQMMDALEMAREQGARIVTGGNRLDRPGFFVEPDHRSGAKGCIDNPARDLCADPLDDRVRHSRRGDRDSERGDSGLVVGHLHRVGPERREIPQRRRLRLWNRQREHRDLGCRDRWSLRWGEGDWWGPGGRLRRLEGIHAPADHDDQLG